ncbi:hypothetical protein AB0Q95_12235 [Streptomyces sp. NPDC059900]
MPEWIERLDQVLTDRDALDQVDTTHCQGQEMVLRKFSVLRCRTPTR